MNKEKVILFLLLFAFLIVGLIVGRSIGIAQCNNHYQSKEVQEEIYKNYVNEQKKLDKSNNFIIDLDINK